MTLDEQDALVEELARALDPNAWAEDLPIPTRAHTVAFHVCRARSVTQARAIIPIIEAREKLAHAAGVAEASKARVNTDTLAGYEAGLHDGLEEGAAAFEAAVSKVYPSPPRKIDKCEHGKFGWEDCIACYDNALGNAVATLRQAIGADNGR